MLYYIKHFLNYCSFLVLGDPCHSHIQRGLLWGDPQRRHGGLHPSGEKLRLTWYDDFVSLIHTRIHTNCHLCPVSTIWSFPSFQIWSLLFFLNSDVIIHIIRSLFWHYSRLRTFRTHSLCLLWWLLCISLISLPSRSPHYSHQQWHWRGQGQAGAPRASQTEKGQLLHERSQLLVSRALHCRIYVPDYYEWPLTSGYDYSSCCMCAHTLCIHTGVFVCTY